MKIKLYFINFLILTVFLLASCTTESKQMMNTVEMRTNTITVFKTNFIEPAVQGPSPLYYKLQSALTNELNKDMVTVNAYPNIVTVNIIDIIFFDKGKFTIKPEGYTLLDKIGKILRDIPQGKVIQIEGHTDDIPIADDPQWKIPNNWSLGSRRAINVALYLIDKFNMDPTRISVLSFSKYRPMAPNNNERNMAKNRRIEIVVLNQNVYQAAEIKEFRQK